MINYFLLMSVKINLTLLLVDLPLVIFVCKSFSICINRRKNQFTIIYGLFALYVLLSFFPYCFTDTPLICYFKGLQYYFVPLCFAPLGYSFVSNHDYNKCYLYACAICFVVGFFLYATLPSYYIEYLAEVQGYENFSQEELMGATRFSSFLPGSYNISYLSVPALIISLAYSSNENVGIRKWLCYLIAFVSFIAAILCQQRISMAFSVLVLSFFAFYLTKHGNRKFILALGIASIILVVVINNFVSEMELYDALKGNIQDRLEKMNVSVAMSSRTGQYTSFNRDTWWSVLTGLGMGSCGHLAIPYGLKTINDGELVKTFYEYGLIGTTLFSLLMVVTLIRGVKFFKYFYAEVIIMLFFLGACIGASALTFFIYNSMFWFSLGRIWNKDYLYLRKQETSKNVAKQNSVW